MLSIKERVSCKIKIVCELIIKNISKENKILSKKMIKVVLLYSYLDSVPRRLDFFNRNPNQLSTKEENIWNELIIITSESVCF